jgi:hypothetical protein
VVGVSEVIDPNDPWLADSSNLLFYRRGVEAGRIQLSESGDLDGTPVWVLRANSPGPGSSALYLDKERLLPLRIDVDGRPAVVVHSEEVARAALPAALFVARHRPAPGRAVYRNRRLAPSDLRRATSFPAYTLGRSYSGFQLSAITLETRSDSRAPFPWQPQLYFGYVQGGDIYADHVISFAELSAKGDQARRELTVYRATGARYRVRIGGVARTVYIVQGRAFAVVLGDTLVKGQADLPAGEIVAMLSKLRRAG